MNENEQFASALALAAERHRTQVDKNGRSYLVHIMKVVDGVSPDIVNMTIAALHDIVEDTDTPLSELSELGFSDEVVTAVDCLTKRYGEKYDDAITRVLTNKRATAVKMSDLNHNIDVRRYSFELEPGDVNRLNRYILARKRILKSVGHV